MMFQDIFHFVALGLPGIHFPEAPKQFVARLVSLTCPGPNGAIPLNNFRDVSQGFVKIIGDFALVSILELGGEELSETL